MLAFFLAIQLHLLEYNASSSTSSSTTIFLNTQHTTLTTSTSTSTFGERKKDNPDPILQLLQTAGYDYNNNSLTDLDRQKLPRWSDITELYGDGPRIVGLETHCAVGGASQLGEGIRSSVPRVLAVAGTFNSGTNLLAELVAANCPVGTFLLPQVPWGKHWPASYRGKRVAKNVPSKMPVDMILPIVIIRDPYEWLQSMCRNNYEAKFDHDPKHYCPNIVLEKQQTANNLASNLTYYTPVHVSYDKTNGVVQDYQSLVHMWNEWYKEYLDATFPRIIIRLEDLLFYPTQTLAKLCSCGGMGNNNPQGQEQAALQYPSSSAKYGKHHTTRTGTGTGSLEHNKTGLLDAMLRFGNPMHRRLETKQSQAVKELLSQELMETFGYPYE
jgi:hypothetical protein